MQQFESFSANVSIVGKDLQRTFYRLFYLQLCDSSGQLKKHCVKDLLAIWEMLLQENSRNHNSYWFSYKIAFILFLSFLTNQKQESGFSKMVVWQQEIFFLLFIASHRLLQSHVKFNRRLKRNFLTCYSCLYYSFDE